MAAMRRDVNLGLLLMIVAALLMFSGFTVYYQTTFKKLSNTYQNELKELEKISKDLESKRGLLNDTSIQLQLRKQKEEDLSKKYVDTESQRSQLETDKKKLEVDLAGTKATLANTESKLTQTQNQLTATIAQFQDEQTKRQRAESERDSLQADVADKNRRIACLKSNAGASETC